MKCQCVDDVWKVWAGEENSFKWRCHLHPISEWLTIKMDGCKAMCLCWKLKTRGIADDD
jgi:hypothetical protein